MAPHSSALAWKIPWMEEPGGLQSMGSLRVRQDWATSLSLSHIGEGNGNPLQCSCLENPRDRGAWWASVYGVAQSQTRLKRLSSSSSSSSSSMSIFPLYTIAVAVVQSLSHVWHFAVPGTATHQDSLSCTISQSLLKLFPLSGWCNYYYCLIIAKGYKWESAKARGAE